MLLTLTAPSKRDFGYKPPHDQSPPLPPASSRFSPKAERSRLPSLAAASTTQTMTQPHRGLPPPAAMTLPDPNRPTSSLSQSMGPIPGQMPAPPTQWQNSEESMRNWLMAKSEEDKRKQEEERTRQETLKLEQRKIEQSMLRDSMQGGIPPHMVPVIFAGIGGGNLTNLSLDWLQQYMAQLQATQQQQQHLAQSQVSSELRRDSRVVSQAQLSAYGFPSQSGQASGFAVTSSVPSQHQHTGSISAPSYSVGPLSPSSRARPSVSGQAGPPPSGPRHSSAASSTLPRLTTNEVQIQQPPTASAVHQAQQSQAAQAAQQEQSSSSPSIYFHHWIPPNSQAGSSANQPSTPSEYTNSPKKRKAQGSHQPAPPPSSGPQFTSPSFSHASSSSSTSGRRGTHTRTRSDTSARGLDGGAGPSSRRGTISSTQTEGSGPGTEAAQTQIGQHDPSLQHQQQHQRSQSIGEERNENGRRAPSASS